MTPDFKRLCQAAEDALPDATTTRPTPAGDEDVIDMEIIVRAVLTALREVSDDMVEAGGQSIFIERDGLVEILTDTIDHILAEPATA